MIQILIRYLNTIFGLYVICIYVLTDDVSGEGSMMDQIKDFAAFVIVYDIDTIIMGPLFNNFFRPQDMTIDDDHKKLLEEKKKASAINDEDGQSAIIAYDLEAHQK